MRITDVGEHEGVPFAVLQFLGGGSLEDRVANAGQVGKRFDVADLASWLPDVAGALDAIHQKGYVHRDVKPGNILFDESGEVYLSDFGIVKALDRQHSEAAELTLTRTGMVIGTPEYMAPEVLLGQDYDGRADQYSLAVMLYELLSGQHPFGGPTPAFVIVQQTTVTPSALETLELSIASHVSAAVAKAMNKDPQRRFPGCRTFVEQIVKTATVPSETQLPLSTYPPVAPPRLLPETVNSGPDQQSPTATNSTPKVTRRIANRRKNVSGIAHRIKDCSICMRPAFGSQSAKTRW